MFPYANHTGTYKNIGKAYVPLFFVNTKRKNFVVSVGIDDYFLWSFLARPRRIDLPFSICLYRTS